MQSSSMRASNPFMGGAAGCIDCGGSMNRDISSISSMKLDSSIMMAFNEQ